ncbi:MAG: HNH endonuclease [Bacteroidetes bacterium]|nr:HNH endonuclease [Bacteroidota bacterium]
MKALRGKSRHHIIPRSRGGKSDKTNLALLKKKDHELYHELFGNKTPDEILFYLVNYFWNGQIGWLIQTLLKAKTKRGIKG